MKVLLATMQFGQGYGQGTERYVRMLLDGLRELGHTAWVLAGDPERRGPRRALGVPLAEDSRILACPTHGWMSVQGLAPAAYSSLLARLRPELVHVANPAHVGTGLLEAAGALGIPTVVTVMDFWWMCPKHTLLRSDGEICDARVTAAECRSCIGATSRGLAGWLSVPVLRTVANPLLAARQIVRGLSRAEIRRWDRRQPYLRGALADVGGVIFPSDTARRLILEWLERDRALGTAVPRVATIRYGLEPAWFNVSRTRPVASHPRPPDELIVGFAGALAPHKGPHLLLEALKILGWNHTRVRLAGGGDDPAYRRRLERLAAGRNVQFVGRLASERMPEFLTGLDLLVIPSLWLENQPFVALEALAVGTPVLASRVGGIAEVLGDERLLFAAASAAHLAKCLEQWVRDPITKPPVRVSRSAEMVAQTLAFYDACAAVAGGRYSGGQSTPRKFAKS